MQDVMTAQTEREFQRARLVVPIEPSVLNELTAITKARHMPRSEFVRMLLNEYLTRRKARAEARKARQSKADAD